MKALAGSMPFGVWRLFVAVAMLPLLIGPSLAASPATTCAATKYKAAGRKLYGKAKCNQKALLEPSFATDDCLGKVEQKFVAAFARAHAKGGCDTQNNATGVEAVVDDCLASFTAAIIGDAKCAAAKTKAVGRRAYDEMNCRAKALLRPVDEECLGKAELRFTTAIAKADDRGTCSDAASALRTLVDACITQLNPGCGENDSLTCGGPCDAGWVCTAVSTSPLQCGCAPAAPPCGSDPWPTCGGACEPGTACMAVSLGECGCVGSCSTSEAPTCGGTCVSGELCGQASGSDSCMCVTPDNTCTISEAPACGGTCPQLACCPAGQACGEASVGGSCDCMCPPNSLACPFSAKWGTGGSGGGQFDHPSSIAVDPSGNVFVMDSYNYRVQKFTSAGTFLTSWGSVGAGDGQFSFGGESSIAVDASGNVFVADMGNHRVQKFDNSGTFLTKWGGVSYPSGIAVDAAGDVFVVDRNGAPVVRKFTATGTLIISWGTEGSGDGQFQSPTDIAVDGSGNVFVADAANLRIQKFTNTGTFLSKWGSYGSADGQFGGLWGIGVDDSGSVLVADVWNHRIQKFDNGGTFVATWGCPGGEDGQFTTPSDAATDGSGNVFVADKGNNRVQKFSCP